MIETAIRRLVEHPRGMLIVIILSFGVGLVLVLPLVDEYSALREQADKLVGELAEAGVARENLPLYEQRITKQLTELATHEARVVSDEKASEFRHQMVALVRESGCQVRRVSLSEPRARDWLEKDDPVRTLSAEAKKSKPSGYELKSRVFNLSISGNSEQIQSLLAALHKQQPLAHTRSLSLRPEDVSRQEILLEIELWLFELVMKQAVSA